MYTGEMLITYPEVGPEAGAIGTVMKDPDLFVDTRCDMCMHYGLMWSFDFEELMLCCPSCKAGERIYRPWEELRFVTVFNRQSNWITVTIQSIRV